MVSGIGVLQGNGGTLRPGLRWQAVQDGGALFDNGWVHLLALRDGQVSARYRPGLKWAEAEPLKEAA